MKVSIRGPCEREARAHIKIRLPLLPIFFIVEYSRIPENIGYKKLSKFDGFFSIQGSHTLGPSVLAYPPKNFFCGASRRSQGQKIQYIGGLFI